MFAQSFQFFPFFFPVPLSIPSSVLLVSGSVLGFMESLKEMYNMIPALYRQDIIW